VKNLQPLNKIKNSTKKNYKKKFITYIKKDKLLRVQSDFKIQKQYIKSLPQTVKDKYNPYKILNGNSSRNKIYKALFQ